MILQPHNLVFVGPIGDPGDTEVEYQVSLNIALGLNPDEVVEDNYAATGSLPSIDWSVWFKDSVNYKDSTFIPQLVDVLYAQQGDTTYESFWNSASSSYSFVQEFTTDESGNIQPIFYDVVCSLKGIPANADGTYAIGKLELPIVERFNSDNTMIADDTITFRLIYGYKEIIKTVSTFTNPDLFEPDNLYIGTSVIWNGIQKLFGVITSDIQFTDSGMQYNPNIAETQRTFWYKYKSPRDKLHIEQVQRAVQSQWFSGFVIRNYPDGYARYHNSGTDPLYGLTEVSECFATTDGKILRYSALIVNPHAVGPVDPATQQPQYDYALVYYTSPFKVYEDEDPSWLSADKDYSYVYVFDVVEGLKPIGKVQYYDDKYYVVPLKPGQVLLSSDGLMVSSIHYITV